MRRKGWLGLILAVIMVFTMTPPTAFGADDAAFEVIATDGTSAWYTDVKEARNAMQDGYTLKLLKDYVSTSDYNFGISLDEHDITIDMNGYSITSNNTGSSSNGYALKLKQTYGNACDNTVTIKNSSTTKQSVLASSSYQIITGSGNSKYNQIIKIEGDIVFRDIDGETPLGIELGTGAKLLDTDSARALVPNGGFSVKEADGSSYIYGDLSNAAGRSADGNIVLLNDYVGPDKIASGQKDGALDLDGHTYTYTGSNAAIDVNYPNVTLTVKNGSVVVTDESADGAVLVGAPNAGNMNNRGLVLDNVQLTVPGNSYGIVTNGTETGNTVTLRNNSILNVKNGFGLYFPSTGNVIIENSTINAKHAGVQLCAGNLTVTGETVITVTGQPQEKTDNEGAIADGAAVSIINREGYKDLGTVNIESGTFNSAADVEAVKAYSFKNANKTEDEWAEAGDTVNVKGGSFSSDIAENIVKSDMKATVTSGGETTVVIGKQAVENAIAELKAGDKIKFQSVADDTDVKIPEGVEVTNSTGKNMNINGTTVEAGETITVEPYDFSGGGTVTPSVTKSRVAGDDRFETAIKVADKLKSELGVVKFNNIVVANSDEFADALSATALAADKDAPILVVNKNNESTVKTYIANNLVKGGNVYIIGGTAVVSESFEKSLTGCKVTRLGGSDRYETNLAVLKAIGVTGASDIMVASGLKYPDALSASATGNPVLLVGKTLTDNQKAYLATLGGNDDYYVIGGTAAVNATVMNQLKASKLGDVVRLEGNDRYETAAAVAEEFFGKAKTLVIASGNAFPDGLTGGVLANAMNAPLMLVNQYNTADAADFVDDNSVRSVVAIGGTAAISNAVLNAVA